MNPNTNLNFLTLTLTLVLAAFKLDGKADYPWITVFAPYWVMAIVLVVSLVIIGVATSMEHNDDGE